MTVNISNFMTVTSVVNVFAKVYCTHCRWGSFLIDKFVCIYILMVLFQRANFYKIILNHFLKLLMILSNNLSFQLLHDQSSRRVINDCCKLIAPFNYAQVVILMHNCEIHSDIYTLQIIRFVFFLCKLVSILLGYTTTEQIS